MKIQMAVLCGSVSTAMVAGGASAATYSSAQLANDGSNLYNSGTQIIGEDFGGSNSNVTVNGVSFELNTGAVSTTAGGNIGDRNAASSYFTGGSADLQDVMVDIVFGTPFDVVFTGLVDGESYVAQFLSWDAAVVGFGADIDGRLQTISSTVDATTFDFQQGVSGTDRNPVVVTVEFVADGTSETFTLAARGGNDNAILNATTLHLVPEPGTLALLGLGGLALLRRRR